MGVGWSVDLGMIREMTSPHLGPTSPTLQLRLRSLSTPQTGMFQHNHARSRRYTRFQDCADAPAKRNMHGNSNRAIPKSLSEPTLHLLRTKADLLVKRAWRWLIIQGDLAVGAG